METKKFTVCYRHIDTNETFCDHCEGRVWSEAANTAIEKRIQNDRVSKGSSELEKDNEIDLAVLNYRRARYEILFVFNGHQKQIV